MGWHVTLHINDARQALDCARDVIAAHPLQATAGATSLDGQVVVVRVLAPVVEPAMALRQQSGGRGAVISGISLRRFRASGPCKNMRRT